MRWHTACIMECQVLLFHELGPGLEFMLAPARVVQIFIEDENAAGNEIAFETMQNRFGGGVQIAINMREGNRLLVADHEAGQGLVEIADDKLGVRCRLRRRLREGAGVVAGAPVFGQAVEAVKTVYRAGIFFCDEAKRAPCGNAEFEKQSARLRLLHAMADQLFIVGKTRHAGEMMGSEICGIKARSKSGDCVVIEGIAGNRKQCAQQMRGKPLGKGVVVGHWAPWDIWPDVTGGHFVKQPLPQVAKSCQNWGIMRFHASCAALGRSDAADAVLLVGQPGAGKSDLLLRLVDAGWGLVADDQVDIEGGLARPPAALAGLIEVRGLGIFRRPFLPQARVRLVVELGVQPERLPAPSRHQELGLPLVVIDPAQPSAVARCKLALDAACGRAENIAGVFAL